MVLSDPSGLWAISGLILYILHYKQCIIYYMYELGVRVLRSTVFEEFTSHPILSGAGEKMRGQVFE